MGPNILTPRAPPQWGTLETSGESLAFQRRPPGHERRSAPNGSPCLSRTHVQPFCLQPPAAPATSFLPFTLSSVRGRAPVDRAGSRPKEAFLLGSWRELRTALAGSLVGKAESSSLCVMSFMSRRYGRVVHLRQLSTSCFHDAVAFGYRRVKLPPDRDLHPAMGAPSQAHECGASRRFRFARCKMLESRVNLGSFFLPESLNQKYMV